MAYAVKTLFEDGHILVNQQNTLGGIASNGTGTFAAAPLTLAAGLNTITVTKPGTFVVTLPSGTSAVIATGTGAITGSPVTALGGTTTTVTFTGVAGQTFTVTTTVNATAEVIEVVGLRTVQAVIGASLSGGYKLDPAAVSIAGNKVTIQPQYYAYNTEGGIANDPAINVPTTVDLSAIICQLTVIGY